MIKQITTIVLFLALAMNTSAQVRVKSLDPEMMNGKILYIPDYNPDDPVIKRWVRKGKDSKISAAEEYASLWREVMEESSWDVTPYEIKAFDEKKMIKSKDPKALLLKIYGQSQDCGNYYVTNWYASVIMTGPKKKVIATALINDLDWWERPDLRLIVNMLSNSLNEAVEAYEEDQGSKFKATKSAYKQNLVDFMDGIGDKTFLVVRSAMHEDDLETLLSNPDLKEGKKKRIRKRNEKNKSKDEAVEEALKESWKMSNYKMVYDFELLEYRDALSEDHFFWINLEINTCSPIAIGANRNHIFSTNGDKVLAAFAGKGKMKPATVDNIQKKLLNRQERFKKQLAK